MDELLQALTLIGQIAGPFAATIAAIASLVGAFRSNRNGRKAIEIADKITAVHQQINGRMGEMLDLTAKKSHAEGVLQEKTRADESRADGAPDGCEFYHPKPGA